MHIFPLCFIPLYRLKHWLSDSKMTFSRKAVAVKEDFLLPQTFSVIDQFKYQFSWIHSKIVVINLILFYWFFKMILWSQTIIWSEQLSSSVMLVKWLSTYQITAKLWCSFCQLKRYWRLRDLTILMLFKCLTVNRTLY